MRTSGVSAVPAPAEREPQPPTRRSKRRTAAVVVGLLVAALSPFVASAADDTPPPPTQDPAVPVVGSLPLGFNPGPENMRIDPALHIGAINREGVLNLYDLAGLHALAPINLEIQDSN